MSLTEQFFFNICNLIYWFFSSRDLAFGLIYKKFFHICRPQIFLPWCFFPTKSYILGFYVGLRSTLTWFFRVVRDGVKACVLHLGSQLFPCHCGLHSSFSKFLCLYPGLYTSTWILDLVCQFPQKNTLRFGLGFALKLFFFFFFEANYFTILYWFCHTLTWICHGCTCVPHLEPPLKN